MATRTAARKEFLRWFNQLRQDGWWPSSVSRWLGVSPSSVSHYRSGKRSPRPIVLAAIRNLASSSRAERTHPRAREVELRQQIEFLRRHDRPSYRSVIQLLAALHERAVQARAHRRLGVGITSHSGHPEDQCNRHPKPRR